jgi:tetratricopeptide (TPR) repeat protein
VNSKDGAARASLASYLIALGDKRQALEEIERAVDLSPKDENVMFRSALVYELAGDRGRALKALSSAAANGYSMAVIQAASDLAELRKDPRYRDLIEGRSAP